MMHIQFAGKTTVIHKYYSARTRVRAYWNRCTMIMHSWVAVTLYYSGISDKDYLD